MQYSLDEHFPIFSISPIYFLNLFPLLQSTRRTGQLVDKYEIPAKQVTSVAFGGPNLDILFVTTAARGVGHPDTAGHLYQITGLNATGYAGVDVKV